MIDLKTKGLPKAITVEGQSFFLNTDFSIWLDFPDRIKRIGKGDALGYSELFTGDVPMPIEEVLEALKDFYSETREVPRVSSNGVDAIDYSIDADYIYAAFLQAYGIDLLEEDMHWHKFVALLAGLPDDTLMVKIMQYRSYDGTSKDPSYKARMKLKEMWRLPSKITDEEQEALEEFNKLLR